VIYRSLKALWTYLKKRDIDVTDIMEKIKDLIIKTIIRFEEIYSQLNIYIEF
jgi:hypothetical protein